MTKTTSGWSRFAVVAFALGVVACSSSSSSSPTPTPTPSPCDGIAVSRFKELTIVDDAVVNDARASNANGGPWSFRYLVEQLSPQDPQAFVQHWIYDFADRNTVNAYTVPARPNVLERLICPWLQRTPANGCDATCSNCATTGKLDLKEAPFKLIAIVNRMDLRLEPHEPTAGEGRFVFALMDRAGDDPAAQALDMTVIFEYQLAGTQSSDLVTWAKRWHALGALGDFDDGYKQALEALTHKYSDIGADPARPTVAPLGQMRTNERVFYWQWELREYHIDGTGQLVLAPTARTPDATLNNTQQLADYIKANRDAILTDSHDLPVGLLAGETNPFQWQAPGIDETARHAFALQTCNGCHQTDNKSIDVNFQLSPHHHGVERLSPFLNDPADPAHDELAHRSQLMRNALCGQ